MPGPTITSITELLEDARNEGRHEGISTFFDEMKKALDRGADMRVWYLSARGLYEEFRPVTGSAFDENRAGTEGR